MFLNRSYEAKKISCATSFDYVKIHAYRNDSIYNKDYESLKDYSRCGESRYKQKENGVEDDDSVAKNGVPFKVIWYLPIIQRFKRLFVKCQ